MVITGMRPFSVRAPDFLNHVNRLLRETKCMFLATCARRSDGSPVKCPRCAMVGDVYDKLFLAIVALEVQGVTWL